MNNIKYLKYLLKHKYYVAKECFKQGLFWRGLVHDLSKFSPLEWKAYRNYFYGEYIEYNRFPQMAKYEFDCWAVSKEGVSEAFDYAWLNHQHKNPHHWQHWVLKEDSGNVKIMRMPTQYAVEMVCDWIGAGIAITGKREANLWYEKNKDKMQLHEETRILVEGVLADAFNG